jgi:hypothetical protein
LGFPETVHAGAEASERDFRRGVHSAETWHDHLFISFSAVVAAVFGDLKELLLMQRVGSR